MTTHNDEPEICLECRIDAIFECLELPVPGSDDDQCKDYDPPMDMEGKLFILSDVMADIFNGDSVLPFTADEDMCAYHWIEAIDHHITCADAAMATPSITRH